MPHDRLQRVLPLGEHLDLHPAQLHGSLTGAHHNHGVVEGQFGRIGTTDAQHERPPPRADLEDLTHRAPADDGVHPSTDRSVTTQRSHAVLGQLLGNFEALA